jgi:hypothetical protein
MGQMIQQNQPRVMRAFVFDRKDGPVIAASKNSEFEIARALSSMGMDFDTAKAVASAAVKKVGMDSAATTNQLASVRSIEGTQGLLTHSVSEERHGIEDDGGLDTEALRGAIADVEALLKLAKQLHAKREASKASAQVDGWLAGEEPSPGVTALPDSDGTAPGLAASLDLETERAATEDELAATENMFKQMGAQDAAFTARTQRLRQEAMNGAADNARFYRAGVASAMDSQSKRDIGSMPAAEKAMRDAGIVLPRGAARYA